METTQISLGSNWKRSIIFPERYFVSRSGEVYSVCSMKIIRPAIDKYGYCYYTLCVNGNRKTVKGHRLVALTFIENPENKPTVNHKNGIRNDNRVENLEWMTSKEQANDPLTYAKSYASSMKRDFKAMGEKRNFGRRSVLVYKGDVFIGMFPSQHEASLKIGVSEGKVSQCLSGQKRSCRGYNFKLAVEDEDKKEGEQK